MLRNSNRRLLISGLLLLAGVVLSALVVSNGSVGIPGSQSPVHAPSAFRSSRGKDRVAPSVFLPLQASPVDVASASATGIGTSPVAGDTASLDGGLSASGQVPTDAPSVTRRDTESSVVDRSVPDVSFPGGQPWIVTDQAAPGSTLSFNNQTATVTAAQPVSGSNGVALAVVMEDSMHPSPETSPEPSPEISDAPAPDSSDGIVRNKGFTYEESLFRMRWGWAAYGQVQKILREETSD